MRLLLLILINLLFSQALWAAPLDCKNPEQKQELGKSEGNADLISNFWQRKGSLAVECGVAISEGFEKLDLYAEPDDLCAGSCSEVESQVYLITVPSQFLEEYSDKALCEEMLEKTTKRPIKFKAMTKNVSELQSWINHFSQGKNEQGAKLYERCPGACSPQYEYFLEKKGEGYEVDAHVICGHARNKSQNTYQITYGLRWVCLET